MTLIDTDGRSWILSVIGYQFPRADRRDDRWDRNWLCVRLRCEDGVNSWERSDPTLTTWDVAALVRWLHDGTVGTIEFVEPSLAFDRLERTSLTMRLDHGFRPPSSAQWADSGVSADPVRVEFHAPPSDFVATALTLAADAERFPAR